MVKTVIASGGSSSGGILVLWKRKDISVDVLQDDSVHMKVVQEKKSECLQSYA